MATAHAETARVIEVGGRKLVFSEVMRLPHGNIEVPLLRITHERLDIMAFPNLWIAASAAADVLYGIAQEHPHGAIIWPTGQTQEPIFTGLTIMARQDPDSNPFPGTIGYEVDQYVGCEFAAPESFNAYHARNVHSPLGIETFHYIDGTVLPAQHEADRYNYLLSKHSSIACVALGIDPNEGHIGFIRPGTPLTVNYVHVAELTDATRTRDTAERKQPLHTHAITQGYNILGLPGSTPVENIMLSAFGGGKGKKLRQAWFDGGPTVDIPVSNLVLAPNKPKVFLDAAAAKEILFPEG